MPNEEDIIESVEDDDEGEGENEDEDQSWVLDSLVGFLKSPLWSSSLNNFVDQMSVVFEPDDIEDNEGNVEHRPEYESVFKQYRALVDQLITSHMTELGISEAQFASACEMAEGVLASKLKSVLFEELWAAENFEVFVRLMSRRNVELQLEALDTLAQQYGLVYDVFVPIGTSAKHFLSEEHVMREAILRSLDDMEQGNEQGEGEEDARRTESLLSRRFSKLKSNDKSNAAAAADKQAPSSEAAAEKSGETS
ncbi:PREDICTED: cilia- and flagella-associated protein 36-like, partial [Rhagoletis zephyria]|uniref:cilia- and flagella-associated protein 36-like n=1 Tax=Rhagoletis zephyria TaxID=28612 RepID=UPI000811A5FC